jgi:hypothetical protein
VSTIRENQGESGKIREFYLGIKNQGKIREFGNFRINQGKIREFHFQVIRENQGKLWFNLVH